MNLEKNYISNVLKISFLGHKKKILFTYIFFEIVPNIVWQARFWRILFHSIPYHVSTNLYLSPNFILQILIQL